MKPFEDRVAGVLFGLAAGDRIGGPVRMALRVAESLGDSDGFDISDLADRYLQWWRAGAFDTGPTVARVLALVESGLSFEQASTRVHAESGGMTAGCNPAHRATPLAMCSRVDDVLLDRLAVAEARLTHRHALAGDVSAAATRLCRALIRGQQWTAALALSAQGRAPETRRALHVKTETGISRSGFAPDVLGAAVYFVQASTSFSEALERSIQFACAANYCPVLVGSIGGARWGRSQVEDSALCHHGDLMIRLDAAGNSLATGWQGSDPQSGSG